MVKQRISPNNNGLLLIKRSELIRKSARKEFELARFEKDPVLIMKMILTSREAILKTKEKVEFFIYCFGCFFFLDE